MKVLRPNFEKRGGLVTVVVQRNTGQVLMVAYTDEAGYLETLATGEAVYYSTSRKERWKKGETSGNTQKVVAIMVDCDGDALVYVVEQTGGACHTGAESCFFRGFIESLQFFPARIGEEERLSTIDVPVHESLLAD
jgi:phosphoribosyl-AMP cyclohydrolase